MSLRLSLPLSICWYFVLFDHNLFVTTSQLWRNGFEIIYEEEEESMITIHDLGWEGPLKIIIRS